MKYPDTPREDHVEDYHGTKVADPYHYMEDPQDQRTKEFVERNNKLVDQFLSQEDLAYFSDKLEAVYEYTQYSVPVKKKNKYFYMKNQDTQPQPIIYMKEGLDGEEQEILDINRLSEDKTTGSMKQYFSDNAKLMAAYISPQGSDWQQILIKDIANNEILETLEWVTMDLISWKPDNSGFYYTKYPDQTELDVEEQRRDAKLYFHRVGTDQASDKLIFNPENKEEGPSSQLSSNGQYLFIYLSESTLPENKLLFRKEGESDFIPIIDKYDGAFYEVIDVVNSRAFVRTSFNAMNNRIIAIDLEKPDQDTWEEIIPETDNVLTNAKFSDNKLLLVYEEDVKHTLQIRSLDGELMTTIDLPTSGTISPGETYNDPIWAEIDDSEIIFGFTSFFHPLNIYRYDTEVGKLKLWMDSDLNIDTEDFEVNQVFYHSKDGTRIPMYLIHKKGLEKDGTNPTLLYGYGGFNISLLPKFSPMIYTWVSEGYVFAQPNLRGGGEYGKKWHKQALLENKQNVFDDFIAAAKWLVNEKYTSKSFLGIHGRSNGGLLVGATLIQRPDLFGAAIPLVGVLDMLRYPVQKDAGRFWTKEYGNALENKEHFDFLYDYSPYHNVSKSAYPPTLVIAAEGDDRVAPMHSKKFGAALQHAQVSENPILVRIETKVGHGYGKPVQKLIEDTSYVFSFLKKTIIPS